MSELVRVGVVRQQTEWMIEILQDPATTGVVIVTTPEEMPVNETLDLMGRLDAETDIDIAAVIANRVLPELFNRGEEETFDQLDEPGAREAFSEVVGEGGPDVIDAARLAVGLRRSSATHLATLRSKLPPELLLLYVPYQFTRTHGMRTTRIVAEHLAQEVA